LSIFRRNRQRKREQKKNINDIDTCRFSLYVTEYITVMWYNRSAIRGVNPRGRKTGRRGRPYMRKSKKLMKLTAFLVVLTMLIG